MTLDSSSSQSDSELEYKSDSDFSFSSNSSNSDVVEKWMILGRGNEDGDQCISLNLEGGTDSNAGVCVRFLTTRYFFLEQGWAT